MLKSRRADWIIAGSVLVCSLVLFVALANGLRGRTQPQGGPEVKVRFADITGIRVSSAVKYAGAPAGTVTGVRILNAEERAASPGMNVEVELDLAAGVPPLNQGTHVSIASDTLLSDKFVLITEGPAGSPALPPGTVLTGVSPVTYDELARNLNDVVTSLQRLTGSNTADGAKNLIAQASDLIGEARTAIGQVPPLLGDTRGVLSDVKTVIGETRTTIGDVRSLVAENREGIRSAVTRLDAASGKLDILAGRADGLVKSIERPLQLTLQDFRVTAGYAKILTRDLARQPSRILWGGMSRTVPTEQQILGSRQPLN